MGSVNNITDFFHNSSLKINGIMTIKSNIENMDDNASLEEQVKITIENLSSTLKNSGSCLNRLVSTTIYLSNIKECDAFEEAWLECFKGIKKSKKHIIEAPNKVRNLKLEIISTAIF